MVQLRLMRPFPIELLALSLLFYVALILSIYVFHKPAQWAFLGLIASLLLALITEWLYRILGGIPFEIHSSP